MDKVSTSDTQSQIREEVFHDRDSYLDIAVPLYRAALEGDLEAAKVILKDQNDWVRYGISERSETLLHVAAMGHSTAFVRYLVDKMSKEDLQLQNVDGNTAFCLAAISGNVDIAKIMIMKNPALPTIFNSEENMPLYLAAFHGRHEMVRYLYVKTDRQIVGFKMNDILLKCTQAGIFDVALKILKDNEQLPQHGYERDMLQVLAQKPEAFQEIRSGTIIGRIIKSLLAITGLVTRPALKESEAKQLVRILWRRVLNQVVRRDGNTNKGALTDLYESIFTAATMNNTKFLVVLISEYPDLIWKASDDGKTIFHIAVAYRQYQIFSLLYEIGSMKDLITPMLDSQGNNILHLAGMKPEQNAFDRDMVAAPFQIHNELLWYKEVEGILPPPCREAKNEAGQTPHELFIENHTDLASLGAKWIHETINQSMVVAALVCTIAFSVAFAVPGGLDDQSGYPMFLRRKLYLIFIVVDAISFIFSTSSILMFLSIILSHHQGNTELLLTKWMAGQLALFISILNIVIVFGVSSFILYRNIYKSTLPYIINVSAGVLFAVYVILQYSLYRDAIMATYDPRHFFRLKKHILYHPKF